MQVVVQRGLYDVRDACAGVDGLVSGASGEVCGDSDVELPLGRSRWTVFHPANLGLAVEVRNAHTA